jgi:hypothetical protein
MNFLPWCTKDSQTLRDELIPLEIPNSARLFSFDAVSMYTNSGRDHAMQIMKAWSKLFQEQGHFIPTQAILAGLELVMKHNTFIYGDTHFLQLIGTAMGTPVAVIFANLYFGWREKTQIIPEYHNKLKRLFKHARFIDDVFGIWLGPTDGDWEAMKLDYNSFGILKWEFTDPSCQINFLDLTLWIENGKILTKTYQKPNHPYLYIPPHSAHAPGMIKGTIYGLVRKYFQQNSKHQHFLEMTKLLYDRHRARGWPTATLNPIFIAAEKRIKAQTQQTYVRPQITSIYHTSDRHKHQFFHLTFHPNDIRRRKIRDIFNSECAKTLQEELGISKFTIAYKKPRNIQSIVAKAKLFQVKDQEVSKYLTGELG